MLTENEIEILRFFTHIAPIADDRPSGLDGLRSPGLLLGHAGRSRSEEPPEVILAPRRPRFENLFLKLSFITKNIRPQVSE